MAINQIKVANEAKQDITINKADQILGRLADQTIIAKTIKSVQRGVVEFKAADDTFVFAHISSVDMSKCDVFFSAVANFHADVSICLDSTTSSSLTFHVGKGRDGKVSWQVIEYY